MPFFTGQHHVFIFVMLPLPVSDRDGPRGSIYEKTDVPKMSSVEIPESVVCVRVSLGVGR